MENKDCFKPVQKNVTPFNMIPLMPEHYLKNGMSQHNRVESRVTDKLFYSICKGFTKKSFYFISNVAIGSNLPCT